MKNGKLSELRAALGPNVRKTKDGYKYWRGYFYRMGMTPEHLERTVLSKFPDAKIVDSGDHWHGFVGGAASGSAKDSYMYVVFTF